MDKPSPAQFNYALFLLHERGFSTQYMDKSFKDLGARMNERSGTVTDWLNKMGREDISALIDKLKSLPAK